MKDFIKWLGVNEKIAKIIVWLLVAMVMLIIINAAFDSLGLPYKLNIKNIAKLQDRGYLKYLSAWLLTVANFLSIIMLVFRVKEFKRIFKYSILYLILNIIINETINYSVLQIFIFFYIILFCYFYSKRDWKYAIYGFASLTIDTVIQYICYLYKLKFIDYSTVSPLAKNILSIDYFIIMAVIILVKEIYLKKRGA